MKKKLQFGIFILLLAIVAKYIGYSPIPNQQIVVKFSNAQTTDTEETLKNVKLQLQKIGATVIHAKTTPLGITITYYSASSLDEVQQLFSKQTQFKSVYELSNQQSNQSSNQENKYEFNISHIEKSSENTGGFNGIAVVDIQQKSDRYQSNNVELSYYFNTINHLSIGHKKERLNANTTFILINSRSYIFPEGRAGPIV